MIDKKVYVGNKWKLTLDSKISLVGATLILIKATKPISGGDVSYAATQVTGTTKAYHIFTPAELDEAGLWKFQIYVEFTDASPYHGTTYEKFIYARYG